jgi:hypothetical protein
MIGACDAAWVGKASEVPGSNPGMTKRRFRTAMFLSEGIFVFFGATTGLGAGSLFDQNNADRGLS